MVLAQIELDYNEIDPSSRKKVFIWRCFRWLILYHFIPEIVEDKQHTGHYLYSKSLDLRLPHSLIGPAVVTSTGECYYFVYGERIPFKQWAKRARISQDDRMMIILKYGAQDVREPDNYEL